MVSVAGMYRTVPCSLPQSLCTSGLKTNPYKSTCYNNMMLYMCYLACIFLVSDYSNESRNQNTEITTTQTTLASRQMESYLPLSTRVLNTMSKIYKLNIFSFSVGSLRTILAHKQNSDSYNFTYMYNELLTKQLFLIKVMCYRCWFFLGEHLKFSKQKKSYKIEVEELSNALHVL